MVNKFRRRRFANRSELPEVCLTPLIDTALTLLVIFMVTTPMIQNSIKIDLPEGSVNEAGSAQQQQQEIMVAIDKDAKIYVNSMPTPLNNLASSLSAHLPPQESIQKRRVWLTVDQSDSCTAKLLINVIDIIKGLKGVQDVAIATKRPAITA